jgi:hypothetical protein
MIETSTAPTCNLQLVSLANTTQHFFLHAVLEMTTDKMGKAASNEPGRQPIRKKRGQRAAAAITKVALKAAQTAGKQVRATTRGKTARRKAVEEDEKVTATEDGEEEIADRCVLSKPSSRCFGSELICCYVAGSTQTRWQNISARSSPRAKLRPPALMHPTLSSGRWVHGGSMVGSEALWTQ